MSGATCTCSTPPASSAWSRTCSATTGPRSWTPPTAPIRSGCASSTRPRSGSPLLTLEQARANRERVAFGDLPGPGVHRDPRPIQPDLATLREMIDWQFFFLAWELKGKYPAILEQPAARELFDDANALLDEIIADGSFRRGGAYGFWPAHAEGDDIVVEPGRGRGPAADAAAADRQAGRPGQPVPRRLPGPGRGSPRRVRGRHPRRRRTRRRLRGRPRRLPRRSW